MAGKRKKPEDIVLKLRPVEVLQGQGKLVWTCRVFTLAARGAASKPPNRQRSNGWIGSTTAACLNLIGNIPPAEAEANYYAALETEAKAA